MFGAILAGTGLALSAYGLYAGGQARQDAADASARAAEEQAAAARLKAKTEISGLRRSQGQLRQTQIAGASSGGFGTTGSTGLAIQETEHFTELDVNAIKQESRFASAYLQQQAANLRASGSKDAQAANLAAFGTLLTGGANILSNPDFFPGDD